jgi:nitrite reductase (NADH) large subunit
MSDVLAARLAGRSRRFRGAGQSCSLKLPECPVYALGDYQFSGNAVTHVSGGIYRQLVLDGRRVVGAVIVGRNPEIPRLQEAVESRRRLWRGQIVEFERTGLLWPDSHSDEVALWPAGAAVCNCMRVQRGALSQAVARGCTTVESLAAFTGASTVCGSCKPLLAQLVGARPAELAAPGWRWLLAASLMAFLIATAIYLIPAIPAATTVQGGWKLEPLWRDAFWKQVSGFTMLGLATAGRLEMVENMVKNFAHLIDKIGFIPNGNRNYFCTRSQPPFFAAAQLIRFAFRQPRQVQFVEQVAQAGGQGFAVQGDIGDDAIAGLLGRGGGGA